ncbi:MAG: DNA repair protein RecO [Oscillospiraceae bacterium]|nr:DNA repair protein RecO [Oscillospiraceae bacterium]
MLFTYDGIVVGRREVGDNSCFIDILTDEQGIIEASAHGAKKLNSAILSSASLFAYSTFCLNKTKLRYTVNSAKPKYSFHDIGSDIEKLALASYFAQTVRFCTPEEQTQDSMVRFFAIALYEINSAERLETVRSAFELRYASMLGYHPDLRACFNCGCYEHGEMYFLPDSGELVCGDCFDRDFGGRYFVLPPETLAAMRNILYAPLSRAFRFRISGDSAAVLSRVTEHYLLSRTERTFSALEYYKKLGIGN